MLNEGDTKSHDEQRNHATAAGAERPSSAAPVQVDPEEKTRLVLYASIRPSHSARRPQLMSLSPVSLAVRTHSMLSLGQTARVTIKFLDTGRDVEIDTTVAQVDHERGEMILRFVTLDAGGHEAIAQYIDLAARR
jgi:hypothetical protein